MLVCMTFEEVGRSTPVERSRAFVGIMFPHAILSVPRREHVWKIIKSRSAPMLADSDVATRLPVRDLNRARRFYAEKLGLEPVEERPGGLRYRTGSGFFVLFESTGEASGSHTQMGWEVVDIEATVAALKARGVAFEEYDLAGLKTVNGIAEVAGNYPGKGVGEKGAWFKDSEGNLLGIGQPVR
jgi:catechol 2,3-dioxygenase-like lactoylglutathione lyase family enzyme